MVISQVALSTLINFAARHVHDCDPDEQIPVLHALSESLPDKNARDAAFQLAVAQSKVAALQLDFRDLLK